MCKFHREESMLESFLRGLIQYETPRYVKIHNPLLGLVLRYTVQNYIGVRVIRYTIRKYMGVSLLHSSFLSKEAASATRR